MTPAVIPATRHTLGQFGQPGTGPRCGARRLFWGGAVTVLPHTPPGLATAASLRTQARYSPEGPFSQIVTKLCFKVIRQNTQPHSFAKVDEVSRERRRTISMSFSWPYRDCHDNTVSILQTWIYSFAPVWLRIIRARFSALGRPGATKRRRRRGRTALHGAQPAPRDGGSAHIEM